MLNLGTLKCVREKSLAIARYVCDKKINFLMKLLPGVPFMLDLEDVLGGPEEL